MVLFSLVRVDEEDTIPYLRYYGMLFPGHHRRWGPHSRRTPSRPPSGVPQHHVDPLPPRLVALAEPPRAVAISPVAAPEFVLQAHELSNPSHGQPLLRHLLSSSSPGTFREDRSRGRYGRLSSTATRSLQGRSACSGIRARHAGITDRLAPDCGDQVPLESPIGTRRTQQPSLERATVGVVEAARPESSKRLRTMHSVLSSSRSLSVGIENGTSGTGLRAGAERDVTGHPKFHRSGHRKLHTSKGGR